MVRIGNTNRRNALNNATTPRNDHSSRAGIGKSRTGTARRVTNVSESPLLQRSQYLSANLFDYSQDTLGRSQLSQYSNLNTQLSVSDSVPETQPHIRTPSPNFTAFSVRPTPSTAVRPGRREDRYDSNVPESSVRQDNRTHDNRNGTVRHTSVNSIPQEALVDISEDDMDMGDDNVIDIGNEEEELNVCVAHPSSITYFFRS